MRAADRRRQVSEEEARALGPEWPDALALAGLQTQCAELGRELGQAAPALSRPHGARGSSGSPDAAVAATAAARASGLARSLLAAGRAAARLAAAMHAPAAAGGDAAAAGEALTWLQAAAA